MKNIFITSAGKRIFLTIYEAKKENPVIIFLHATGFYGIYYNQFLTKVRDAGFNVISVDLVGHGRSEGIRGDFTVAEALNNISDTITYAINNYNEKIGMIGSSQGGIFTFYATAKDSRIKSAICHCAGILNEKESDVFVRPRARLLKKAILCTRSFFPYNSLLGRLLKIKIWFYIKEKTLFNDPAYLKLLTRDDLFVDWYSLRAVHSLATTPLPREIQTITTPLLFLCSQNEQMFPYSYILSIYNRLKCYKRLEVLPGASHMVLAENPDQVVPKVVAWFKETL